MKTVLITGAKGFIGKNLLVYLREKKDLKLVEFDQEDDFSIIESYVEQFDIVYHLAGVNRPQNVEEFYEGNRDLTTRLIDLLNSHNKTIPVIFASSIQAELDNDYGKSKKAAEDYILQNYSAGIIYRLHNVFGKWSKPNYNSFVATFCYNIAHNKEIQISDSNKKVELIYIDDICEQFLKYLENPSSDCDYHFIEPRYNISLQEVADLIYSFKQNMNSIYVPNTGDDFVKKLFATYISYVPLEEMITSTKKNVDDRGSFTELVRTLDSGQFSVSFSNPGIVRGNHYHNTKMERFIVIKGQAKISFKKVDSDECIDFYVDDRDIKLVTIPVGYTHNIENVGNEEMILFIWCNELFDEKHPDTYFMEIPN